MAIVLLCASEVQAARKALVIGNDSYEAVEKLRNARADADAMAAALKKAGYAVTLEKDRTLRQMKDVVRAFRAGVNGGDEVVFFFSGHGVQIDGMNQLLPIDVRAQTEDQVRDDSIALGDLLADIARLKPALTLAIIDACRDNPFPKKGRAIGGRGLTGVAGATGQMVIYSAGEGQQALDRLGDNDPVKNGVFTRVFVREMEKPGVSINDVVRHVREEVHRLAESARHEQVPAIYDQVLGRFFFHAPSSSILVDTSPAPASTLTAGNHSAALELAFWNSVKDSKDSQEFTAYLRQYPDGKFTELAKVKQQQLQPQSQLPSLAGGSSLNSGTQAPTPASEGSGERAPGTVFRDCDDCPEMVVIPAGSFVMGSPGSEEGRFPDEGPQHQVSIRSFAAGRYKVTFSEWDSCIGAGGCGGYRPDDRAWGRGNRPVIDVGWDNAQQYVKWISQRTGKNYRLLTEAEWEYAVRAGSTTRYSFGDDETRLGDHAWYSGNSGGRTQAGGGKRANAFGLHDMHGNAWEWVEDCGNDSYAGAPANGSAWLTGNCSRRVARGGSWGDEPRNLRSANRDGGGVSGRSSYLGFRLARTLP